MKSVTQAHMTKAEQSLLKAAAGLDAASTLPVMAENAARDAYFAAFHAAKALIFERTEKGHKTHGGVHSEFTRISRDELGLEPDVRSFMVQAYAFKSTADYETGTSLRMDADKAREAIADAPDRLA